MRAHCGGEASVSECVEPGHTLLISDLICVELRKLLSALPANTNKVSKRISGGNQNNGLGQHLTPLHHPTCAGAFCFESWRSSPPRSLRCHYPLLPWKLALPSWLDPCMLPEKTGRAGITCHPGLQAKGWYGFTFFLASLFFSAFSASLSSISPCTNACTRHSTISDVKGRKAVRAGSEFSIEASQVSTPHHPHRPHHNRPS